MLTIYGCDSIAALRRTMVNLKMQGGLRENLVAATHLSDGWFITATVAGWRNRPAIDQW